MLDRQFLNPKLTDLGPWTIHVEAEADAAALDEEKLLRMALRLQELRPSTSFVYERTDAAWHAKPVARPEALLIGDRSVRISPDDLRVSVLATDLDLGIAPFRIGLAAGEERLRLFLAAHHAVFDGIGALSLMVELLGGVAPAVQRPAERPAAAPGRGFVQRLARLRSLSRRRAVPVVSDDHPRASGFGFATTAMESPPGGVSNDALLTALHTAMALRCSERGAGAEGSGETGVAVPVNLRPLVDSDDGLRNATVLVPTRLPLHLGLTGGPEAQSHIRAQTKLFRLGRLSPVGQYLRPYVRDHGTLPPWCRLAFDEPVALSNLGNLDGLMAPLSELRISGLAGSTPPAPRMSAAFVAFLWAGKLVLSCRNRRALLSDDDAIALLDAFSERVLGDQLSAGSQEG